ncbi:MAG: hypothetical protein MHM6MM_009600, partial [Cercozoa sp. M6MM]
QSRAVLYRSRFLVKHLRKQLNKHGIRFREVGESSSFYKIKEAKDLLAVLRLILNPCDDFAMRRVYGNLRGIGPKAVDSIALLARTARITHLRALDLLFHASIGELDSLRQPLSKEEAAALETIEKRLPKSEAVRTSVGGFLKGYRTMYKQVYDNVPLSICVRTLIMNLGLREQLDKKYAADMPDLTAEKAFEKAESHQKKNLNLDKFCDRALWVQHTHT